MPFTGTLSLVRLENNTIFFSYARADEAFALQLYNDLVRHGVQAWVDQLHLPPGKSWDREIETILKSAETVLIIMSGEAVSSENVLDEIHYALEAKKHIIPILLKPCEIPYRLKRKQAIDFRKDYADALQRLLTQLRVANTAPKPPVPLPQHRTTDDGLFAQSTSTASSKYKSSTTIDPPKDLSLADKAYEKKDFSKALKIYLSNQASLSHEQVFRVGVMYEGVPGIAANYKKAEQCYKEAANKGNVQALNNIGDLYRKGHLGQPDNTKAIEWYKKSAEKGDHIGMMRLGFACLEGKGMVKDYEQAMKWFGQAAAKGNEASMFGIGQLYEKGLGVQKDETLAKTWYQNAIDNGSTEAIAAIGILCMYASRFGEALKWFQLGASKDNTTCMVGLGTLYEKSWGVMRDDRKAIEWYRKSAGKGDEQGMNKLGLALANGRGAVRNDKEAYDWYVKAVAKGNIPAMVNLGNAFYLGRGTEKNYSLALKWFETAAEKENATAMYMLGAMHERGEGTNKSVIYALKWYKAAAEKGHLAAMNSLGLLYMTGRDMQTNYGAALKWLKQAAEQDHIPAMSNLAQLYKLGQGTSINYKTAYYWYQKVANTGNEEAKRELLLLEKFL